MRTLAGDSAATNLDVLCNTRATAELPAAAARVSHSALCTHSRAWLRAAAVSTRQRSGNMLELEPSRRPPIAMLTMFMFMLLLSLLLMFMLLLLLLSWLLLLLLLLLLLFTLLTMLPMTVAAKTPLVKKVHTLNPVQDGLK